MEQIDLTPVYEPFDIEKFIAENIKELEKQPPPDIDKLLANAVDGRQGNGFPFTYNNFTHAPKVFLEMLKTLPYIVFIRFQIEKGESGTIHYQGYIHLSKRQLWGTIRRALIKMGLHRMTHQNRISSPQKASNYCNKIFDKKKDGSIFQTKVTPEVYEFGELNLQQGQRNDINDIIDCVRDNMSDSEIMALYPVAFFHNQKKIDDIRELIRYENFSDITRDIKATFITGRTRIGKTTAIIKKHGYKNVYTIDNYKNPWDRYKGQDIIIFDEFHSQIQITEMLRWLDFHPLALPCRYKDKQACYTQVYFTSNEPFERIYPNVKIEKPKTFDALMARIQNVYNFDDPKQIEKFQSDIPNENPFMPEHLKQADICEQTEMTLLSPEQAKDLPW